MLYIYMGSETFVDVPDYGAANGTITVGYSIQRVQGLVIGIIRLKAVR